MRTINHSVRAGGMLTCSFREADFGDFILKKKREAAHLLLKKAVRNLGAQVENGMLKAGASWVLGPTCNLIIDHAGKEGDTQMSKYICNNAILRPIPIMIRCNWAPRD